MKKAIIQTKNLCFNSIIKYPDINIEKGKVTFITGESGCGKSSLLKLFNATYSQSDGQIFFNGKNTLDTDTIALRRDILLISQNIFLFDDTIKGNFKTFYNYREEKLISDEQIRYFLNLCCVPFDINANCQTMSGGEKQRVYMAILLSFSPVVVMLDEPTSALDSKNSYDVIKNILNYCKKKDITCIVVSHDAKITQTFAEDTIELKKEINICPEQ